MKGTHKLKKPEKLNLVPILDSVFIFIFFLLMSAQFVDVYEIGSSVPMTKEAKEEKEEKDPLNLTLEVTKTQIVVKTGLRSPRSRTFASEQKKEIKEYLTELKRQHPKENTMILKADPKVSFQNLVTVIDSTQASKDSKEKLFEQIVFDNNGVK
ncbi:MAG: ExbD/TolR family protein [Bacteriovoracia bacterium]